MYMNPYQAPKQQFDWIMVPTIDQVEQVAVQPTQKAWVMVQNEPIFALRVADQMGLISTEYFRFEKIERKKPESNYITREELESILVKLKEENNESNSKPNREQSKAKPQERA